MIELVVAAVFAYPVQLSVHELSHAFAVWALGHKVQNVIVWPHYKDNRLYFGRVTYRWDQWPVPDGHQEIIAYAPYAMSGAIAGALSTNTDSVWSLVWGVAIAVDVGRNHLLTEDWRDVTKAGVHCSTRTVIVALSGVYLCACLARILVQL